MKKVKLIWCQNETIMILIDLYNLDHLMVTNQKQQKMIENSQVGILSE